MHSRILATVATVASLSACGAPRATVTDAQRDAATREVTAVVDSLFASMNAGDVDGIYGHYRKSDDFMYVTVARTMRTWDTFSSVTSSFYVQHPDVTFQHHVVQTQVLAPDVAVVTIEGSATTSAHLTWTEVFVKEGGRWVITLEHESWPGAPPPPAPHPMMEPQPADTSSAPGR
jgi:hypothetical protein